MMEQSLTKTVKNKQLLVLPAHNYKVKFHCKLITKINSYLESTTEGQIYESLLNLTWTDNNDFKRFGINFIF